MMRIDLSEHLSDGVRADVRAALAAMRGRPVRVRLVNVPAEALRAVRNKTELAAGTLTVYEEDDATPAWTAAVTQASRDPLTGIDPT